MTMHRVVDGKEVELTPEEEKEIKESWANATPVIISKSRVYKATVWSRCTDAEYDAIQAIITAAPPRLQAIFRDANFLSAADPLYQMVIDGATKAVGADRAMQLLELEE